MCVRVSVSPQPWGLQSSALLGWFRSSPGTQGQSSKAGPLVYFALEVVGGGGGRGTMPQLASALGVTPLQRFPVEAEDVL